MEFWWTDSSLFAIVLLMLISLAVSLRQKHTRHSWSCLLKRPLAISAGIVLSFFFFIAVLDSIHLSVNKEVNGPRSLSKSNSILDGILAPLGNTYEKTYSAPFALTLYNKETTLINDQLLAVYPRLNYPPGAVKTVTDKKRLINKLLRKAALLSAGCLILLWSLTIAVNYFRGGQLKIFPAKTQLSAILTFSCCLFIIIASYWLSRNFHLLGTGKIGEDIFYYAVKSIRTGLVIGVLTTTFMLPVALILGVTAGYLGGLVDDVIQYIYTTLSSIPGVLLITAAILSLQTYISNHPQQFATLAKQADARLLSLCLILGISSWTSLCRVLRSETLRLKELDYVLAAKALGSSVLTIIRKHLMPNVMHIVIIAVALDFSSLILAEAVLSYVGVGVSPTTMSWGNMINGARLELTRDPLVWWPIMAAFIFMFSFVLASNLFAECVRDAFDPHEFSSLDNGLP